MAALHSYADLSRARRLPGAQAALPAMRADRSLPYRLRLCGGHGRGHSPGHRRRSQNCRRQRAMSILGIDVGGTFTDLLAFDEQAGTGALLRYKVSSTPQAPEE